MAPAVLNHHLSGATTFSTNFITRRATTRRTANFSVRMCLNESAPSLAVVGVTGAVGKEFLSVLSDRDFPYKSIKMLASKRSAGKKITFEDKEYVIEELSEDNFDGVDIVLFSAGGSISKKFGPVALNRGSVVIDNSSAFRMDENVPLVIPEVNPDAMSHIRFGSGKGALIANPNCSTIICLMAATPLHRHSKVVRMVVSTYQAASGAGAAAMEELELQTREAVIEFSEREKEAREFSEREKEARVAAERIHTSLTENLDKAQQDLSNANNRIESLNATYRNAQEYNTSLQQYNSRLQMDCETYKTKLERLGQEKAAILDELRILRGQYNSMQKEMSSFQVSRDEAIKQKETLNTEVSCLRAELGQAKEDRDNQLLQVLSLTAEIGKYKEFTGKSTAELDKLTLKSNNLEETCSLQRQQIQNLQHQLTVANEKLKMADLTTLETQSEFEGQKRVVQDLQNRLADAEFQIIEAEKLRKKLHNTILELKGNIRVFCRVRPLLPDDSAGEETPVISYAAELESLGRGINMLQNGKKLPFTFDKVFAHDSSQEDVFTEISQLVQSALDGYKVCIFAYGQTGSGKTYTMMGRPETPDQKGLIPRSLEQIFESSQSLSSQGWRFKMRASMLEIYNETIRDLLLTNRAGALDIKNDSTGNPHVPDLTIVDVCRLNEVASLLHQAAQSRSVGKTQMNEQSSRSHFVFTLRISGVNESTEQQVHGVLNLIDLAGSERLSRSGATGDRLRETQNINKSLSSLSDVIFALAKKEDHVPFRNSKLTHLLQPCLGGNSKTLMFVNISPDPSSVGESLCSLRFAARVNSCEIGVPRRQTTTSKSDSRLSYG